MLLNIARQPSSNTVAVADAVAAEIAQLRRRRCRPASSSAVLRPVGAGARQHRAVCATPFSLASCSPASSSSSSCATGLFAGCRPGDSGDCRGHDPFLVDHGESFNLMTLGGLAAAIGLVIDDAIVVVENIVLHRDAGETRAEAVRNALHEISRR